MLGKGLFGNLNSGNTVGTRGEVKNVDGKIVYTTDPDVLIENGRVYFADGELNAGIHMVDGKMYAEVVNV